MKNLVIFSKHFWPENFKINDIALQLSKQFNIEVYTSKPNYTGKNFKLKKNKKNYFGVKINYLSSFKKKKNNYTNIIIDYLYYVIMQTIKINFNLKKKVDTILTFATSPIFQALPAIYLAKLKKKKHILWVQDLWPEVLEDTGYMKNKLFLSFINYFVSKIYKNSDIILSQSESFEKHLKKKYNLKNKVYTLHQPSDYNFQKYDNKSKKNFFITYAGNFGKSQDFKTILNAFKSGKIEKNIYLNLIGFGKEFKKIQTLIDEEDLSSKIKLSSYLEKRALKNEFYNSSAFFITLKDGKSLNKTLPGKFQTYIAFGKPLLVCSNGFIGSYVKKNKIGLASRVNDTKSLINNINKLKNLSQFQKKNIYMNSKNIFYKNFEIKNVTRRLAEILEKNEC